MQLTVFNTVILLASDANKVEIILYSCLNLRRIAYIKSRVIHL